MSLTFQVTVPIESLETLQRMSPFYGVLDRMWDVDDEVEAVLQVCKSTVAGFKEFPYELTPKKVHEPAESCPCSHVRCQPSCDEPEDSYHEHDDYDEGDDGSEGYDEIDAEECDHRSSGGSIIEKGRHGWDSTPKGKIEEFTKDVDQNTEPDETDADADVDAPHHEHKPSEFGADETTESKDLATSETPIHITVISNGDWSGNSYRLTVYHSDTWKDLAGNLKRSTPRFDNERSLSFYFGYSFYDENCQALLFKAGVGMDSVVYVQNGLQGQAPMTRHPIGWPGTYAYMPVARDNILGGRQVPPRYEPDKDTVAW